jgi:hypothetical protein
MYDHGKNSFRMNIIIIYITICYIICNIDYIMFLCMLYYIYGHTKMYNKLFILVYHCLFFEKKIKDIEVMNLISNLRRQYKNTTINLNIEGTRKNKEFCK